MKRLALWLIRLYQRTLSYDHGWFKNHYPGGFCRYQPTCSEYSYQAIEKYGFIKGSWLGFKRIMRCNPWSSGGHDPLK